jgi:hypothetical protein
VISIGVTGLELATSRTVSKTTSTRLDKNVAMETKWNKSTVKVHNMRGNGEKKNFYAIEILTFIFKDRQEVPQQ